MHSNAFEPYDLVRRNGIFSSFINLSKKHKKPEESFVEQVPPCSNNLQPPAMPSIAESSEAHSAMDIYREIVSEVENLELSNPATPLSDFPISPVPITSMQANYTPQHFERFNQFLPPDHPYIGCADFVSGNYEQCPFIQQVSQFDAPPAYSRVSQMHVNNASALPYTEQIATTGYEIKQNSPLLSHQNSIALEELVKLVVSAIKNGEAATPLQNQSPEEILKRKRQQNNEAAARYRRRQKAAKIQADAELSGLVKRNLELREEANRIQLEIKLLRKAVLGVDD